MEIDTLYNKEAEENIIAICLTSQEKLGIIVNELSGQDFFDRQLRTIFDNIQVLAKQGKQVDIVTLTEQLRFSEQLEFIGGKERLQELLDNLITVANCKQLIKIIIKYSKKRFLSSILKECEGLLEKQEDVDDVLKYIENTITTKLLSKTTTNLNSLASGFMDVMDEVEKVVYSKDKIFGLSTGFPKLDKTLSGLCKGRLYIIGARPRVGKGYGLDTLTLTPTGWVKNKDIKLGDTVIGRDGKPTKVIGIYPQPLQDCYKMILKDGREIVSDAPHEWTVYSSRWQKERTFTTKELYDKLQCVRYKDRISLPRFTGEYGVKKDFTIPPYVMGVLIGDGCLTCGDLVYCKPNTEVFNKVKARVPQGVDVHFRKDSKTVGITNWLEAKNYIKEVGLNTQSYNKFIPQEYFHSSKEQREELFNGLMDTDGYKFSTGWEYSTSSKQLALDVQQLAWSLGYSCKIRERQGKYTKENNIINTRVNYRVFITTHKPLTIIKIEKVEPIPTQCIHVDNEDSLFVIENYIVTHNSSIVQQIAEYVAQEHNVLFHSLEMKVSQYTKRSVFRRAKINNDMIANTNTKEDILFDKIAGVGDSITKLNLFIDDNTKCTLSTVEKNIIKIQQDKGSCDLVVIDYIQLMQSDNKYQQDKREKIGDISTGLKRLALKYNVPIIALAQLSRALEARPDKRPILSDLKESGDLEQDADVVIGLYRDEIYNPQNKGTAELIVLKNREGACRIIPYYFNGSVTEFMEVKE